MAPWRLLDYTWSQWKLRLTIQSWDTNRSQLLSFGELLVDLLGEVLLGLQSSFRHDDGEHAVLSTGEVLGR
jgi:hypothetical protein